MARSRYRVLKPYAPHFLTATVVNWVPLFSGPALAQILLNSLTFLQAHKRLIVYAYVILENHLHLIASADDLSEEIGDFKSFTARQIVDYLELHQADHILKQLAYYKMRFKTDRDYQVWQEGSHPQLIGDHEMMRQKITDIHQNPVKRGYVDEAIHWRYSSARNYAGLPGLLAVKTDWS